MRAILLTICAIVLPACGTISAQDYTDAKMEAAISQARLDAAAEAAAADARREEIMREAIRLIIEQFQFQDGRRPHRPGGGA